MRRPTALRLLVAAQLAVVLVSGVATVASFPVWALVDERAHYDYVQKVAEDRRLPVLGDLISEEAQAIDEGVYPEPPRNDPRYLGLGGYSYEAFQPPLYYVVAAPAFAVVGDHAAKVRVLRVVNLVLLGLTIAVTWLLARRVAGEWALAAFSLALTVFMWPGVVVRAVTVSNAALEMLLAAALLYALWRAHAGRDKRALVAAGALAGAGLLTRLTLAPLLALVVLVAALALRRSGRAMLGPAALAVALPVLMVLPWLAFNLHHYDALTGFEVVRDMQEPTLNPSGQDYGVSDLPDQHRVLLNGVLAEEWWVEFLRARNRAIRDVFAALFFAVPLGLALRLPRSVLAPAAALLVLPLVLSIAAIDLQLLALNWNSFYPRYLYPVLPAFALFAALGWRRALGQRGLVIVAGLFSLPLALLWLHLTSVTPFTP